MSVERSLVLAHKVQIQSTLVGTLSDSELNIQVNKLLEKELAARVAATLNYFNWNTGDRIQQLHTCLAAMRTFMYHLEEQCELARKSLAINPPSEEE